MMDTDFYPGPCLTAGKIVWIKFNSTGHMTSCKCIKLSDVWVLSQTRMDNPSEFWGLSEKPSHSSCTWRVLQEWELLV